MFSKELYPECDTEGPFGIPMRDEVAKEVEKIMAEYKGRRDDAILKFDTGVVTETFTDERWDVSKIATEAIDRDREIVRAKGIDLGQYQKNPVVLVNHQWDSLPVGKALWIKPQADSLVAKTQYAKRPGHHQGEWIPESVFELVKQGILQGKSIGFLPLDSRTPTQAEISAKPELKSVRRIIEKSLLLEYSVVSVPSNQEALVEQVSKSFPGLLELLDLSAAEVVDNTGNNGDQLQARIEELAKRIKTLEEDRDAVLISIRDIRKKILNVKAKQDPAPDRAEKLLDEINRRLATMA